MKNQTLSFQKVLTKQNVTNESSRIKKLSDSRDINLKLLKKSKKPLLESRDDSQLKPIVTASTSSLPQTWKQEDVGRRKSSEFAPGSRVQLKVTLAQTTTDKRRKDSLGKSRDRSNRNEGKKKESGMTYLEKIKIEINRK